VKVTCRRSVEKLCKAEALSGRPLLEFRVCVRLEPYPLRFQPLTASRVAATALNWLSNSVAITRCETNIGRE
jgi:hypothetical protein